MGNISPLQRGFDLPKQSIVAGNIPIVYSNGILKFHNQSKSKAPGLVTGRSGTIGKFTFIENGEYWPHNTSLWVTDFCGNIPKFIYYLYQTINIEQFSTGSGVPTLNRNDVHRKKCSIPNIEEQKKISSFLSLLDEKLQTQRKIIEELNVFKKGIAQKIFSQQLRFKDDNGNDFPEWESKMLGEVLDYEQSTKYLVATTEYDDSFKTPVVTAGKTFILGYTNEEENIFEKEKLPVIIFDDFTTASQFVDFPFKAKSSAMKILKAQKGCDIKFIFEAMQMISYETGGHGRHWISVFSNLEISLPSLLEQQKIANFLSSIDSKIDIENQILQKLEEQKKYFLANMFI